MSQALKEWAMRSAEFDRAYDAYELETEFADFMVKHSGAMIGNGDMLINARESGLYDEQFKEHYLKGER